MNRAARTTLAPAPSPDAPASPSGSPASPAPSAPPEAGPRREPSRELLAHLQSPQVFHRLRGFVLGKRIPARYAEDLVQHSLLEAWRARATWGPTTVDLDKLLRAIVACNVLDHKKSWFRSRLATGDGATPGRDPGRDADDEYTGRATDGDDFEVPPVHVPSAVRPMPVTPSDPHGARYRLRDVSGFVEKTPELRRAAGWMLRSAAGDSFREIADDEGMSENAVCTAVSRLRATLRKAAHDGLIVLMVALFAGMLLRHAKHRPQDDLGVPSPEPAPTAIAPSPGPTPRARADQLRQRAFDACGAKKWQECLDDLDEASQIDPDGDGRSRVTGLRRAATYGLVQIPEKPTPR